VIRYQPEDANLYLDGELMIKAGTYPLALGAHELRIEKDGYQAIAEQIVVDEQNIFFDYKLVRQPDAGLQIQTNPSGATVYLEGVNLGKTPIAVFYKPGVYPIRITLKDFVTVEEYLEVKIPQTQKMYLLEENVGYLTINTHSSAIVTFNGERITDPKNVKLAPQLVRVKVSMPKAEALEQQVVLRRNERLEMDMYPEVQTGTLQMAVTPFDAQIVLTGDAGESYSAEGMHVFEDIPVGTYTAKVSAAGYETKTETIVIKTGERISESIKLENAIEKQTTDFGIAMIYVKGGSFTMGCTSEQGSECRDNEKPAHQVTLSDFYIGKYEVTQKQWRAVMGTDPPKLRFKGCDDCPVERVSWNDIQDFIKKLNQKTGKKYRLPTEAEWEYAARGGSQNRGYKYAGSYNIGEVAWYDGNSSNKTHAVGGKKPNELGIYDMSGNVWEWCNDWYGNYSSGSQRNPQGPTSGTYRVLRGGGWNLIARFCRVSNRSSFNPGYRGYNCGFRLAVSP
jgi:formylglycine-generating enzyme required for sulfatase activity